MPAKVTNVIDWDSAKADPVEFVKTFLRQPDGSRWEPFEAQQHILHGIRRNTSILTGRQFSKTTILGWDCSWFATTRPNSLIWILAPTLDQTRIIFNEVAGYFRTTLKSLVDGKIKNSPFPEIQLKNGSRIACRGLNRPEYVRGNRAHRAYVDEAAFVKDGSVKEVVEQLFLVTGKREGSALVLTSTPFGTGEFYDFTENARHKADAGNERFAYFHYTSFDNPYADREQLEEVRQRYGEDSPIWLAEYMGQFQDDELNVFRTADIKEAYELWPEKIKFPVGVQDGHHYIQGVDLANRRDYFVSTILDDTAKDAVQLVRMDRYNRRGYAFYKDRIRTNHHSYNRARTIGDATSLGEAVIEDMRDIGIIGYTIGSNAAKWEIVQDLSRMLQDHRLILPPPSTQAGKDIALELGYFRYKVTASKVLQMEAPRGRHDDIVMSLAFGAHLAAVPSRLGGFTSIDLSPAKPARRSRDFYLSYNPFSED